MTAPPEDDDTSRRDERATPNNAASDHQRRHTTWDALEVNGLDAAIEALRAAVPKKQTHADPVVTALEAENAALKKKVRRLVRKQKLAEQQRRDQSEPRTQDTRARAHRAIRLLRAGEWPHRRSPGPAAPVWDEILILASPRSGTNYFCESLNAFPEVRGYFEIFNPRGVFGVGNRILPDLAENLGLSDVEDAKDSRLTEVFREHPFVALRALSEVTRTRGASAMAYKVFPRQLDLETIGHLMDDDHRHVIFITRRRIDVYISLRKALLTESWTNQSTADVRPSIDVDDFLTWARDTDDWYTDCYELARDRGKKISIARYEADIDLPRPELVQKASRALQYFGLKVTVPPDVKSPRFLRQDKAVEPFEKITAGEEVRLILQKTQNLRYALEGPLERQATEHPFM